MSLKRWLNSGFGDVLIAGLTWALFVRIALYLLKDL
jgi:hypothetical protein